VRAVEGNPQGRDMSLERQISVFLLTGIFFLPTAVLLSFTFAVRVDSMRHPLSGTRRKVFDAALYAATVAVFLLIAGLTRYAVTRAHAGPISLASNFTAIALWLFGLVGAFFGKHKLRVLLLLAQVTTVFAVWASMMSTFAD
jgi:hypothetical protein